MLKDVVSAKVIADYRLNLRFEDGVEGVLDFEPLRDPAYFAMVRVDPELGTVVWPNGADLDPDVLSSRLTGLPVLQQQQDAAD